MVGRRVLAPITMLIAILALLGAPEAEARKHRHHRAASRTRRCHSDKQCRGSVCNDAGRCCAFGDFACGANCCIVKCTLSGICTGVSGTEQVFGGGAKFGDGRFSGAKTRTGAPGR